jgi:hypothetical protein
MAASHIETLEVLPVSQARDEFSRAVKRFRKEGLTARPVVFGSHRKPEAVTIPYELFDALLPAIEDILLAELVRQRLEEPTVTWHNALAELRVTQDEVDDVNLDDYTVEGA